MAPPAGARRGGAPAAGHSAARAFARGALVPLAALAGAAAGLVFVVLLPICGIASLAEGLAQASWDLLRSALRHARRGALSQD